MRDRVVMLLFQYGLYVTALAILVPLFMAWCIGTLCAWGLGFIYRSLILLLLRLTRGTSMGGIFMAMHQYLRSVWWRCRLVFLRFLSRHFPNRYSLLGVILHEFWSVMRKNFVPGCLDLFSKIKYFAFKSPYSDPYFLLFKIWRWINRFFRK